MRPPESERGAALLSVLLLVAVMSVIASVMLERLHLATRLAANGQAMAQARLYAAGAETLAVSQLQALVAVSPNRTVDPGGLLGREAALPVSRGVVTARIEDAGNCFNLNSLVEENGGVYALRPVALSQLRALMVGLEIPLNEAIPISDAVVDWIDSDDRPLPNGAEDQHYLGLPAPYRTAGQLIGDVSELRAVRGVTEPIYQRLRPWLCALPSDELSPVNVNTLRTEQARLVSMLAPQALDPDRVRTVIAGRPATGYAAATDFLRPFAAQGDTLGPQAIGQLKVTSRWFYVDLAVQVDSITLEELALIDAGVAPARVAWRSWGDRAGR